MKEYKFVIDGIHYKRNRTFPAFNDYIKTMNYNRFVGAQLKKKYERVANEAIIRQLKGVRIEKKVFIEYTYYEADKRRDKSNINAFAVKVIEDALQDCGVLKNDGWDNIAGYSQHFKIDSKNPRIEVLIREVKKDE
nr:hypothetical protein [uncultured Catonella sp.]